MITLLPLWLVNADHDGLPVADAAWPARHFLGAVAADYDRFEPGELPLLECGCGLWFCWPLLARVTVDAGLVTWSAFRQPHREQWGVLPLGPFRFDEGAYVEQLASPVILTADPLDGAPERLDRA